MFKSPEENKKKIKKKNLLRPLYVARENAGVAIHSFIITCTAQSGLKQSSATNQTQWAKTMV